VYVKGTINGYDFQQVLKPDGRWGHWFKPDKSMGKTPGVNQETQ
jgi:hypothetical protein